MRGKLLLSVIAAGSIIGATVLVPSSPSADNEGFFPLAYSASADYFLKIEGVEGESSDDRHKGEIEIQSFSWGVSQMGAHSGGGGGGAGKAVFQDLHFAKGIDKTSPILFQSVPEGKHFKQAVLIGRKAGSGEKFMEIKLTDVLVSSFEQSGGGDVPAESFSLNFTKIEFNYHPQNPDGSTGAPVHGGWDLATNKKV